ncbi:9049_t:CDS:2 [Entrophospora sp. SA101]|nr:9049_t:CDS:2 [Entrophospora sp. SA101]
MGCIRETLNNDETDNGNSCYNITINITITKFNPSSNRYTNDTNTNTSVRIN